jgi:hypothetical protein
MMFYGKWYTDSVAVPVGLPLFRLQEEAELIWREERQSMAVQLETNKQVQQQLVQKLALLEQGEATSVVLKSRIAELEAKDEFLGRSVEVQRARAEEKLRAGHSQDEKVSALKRKVAELKRKLADAGVTQEQLKGQMSSQQQRVQEAARVQRRLAELELLLEDEQRKSNQQNITIEEQRARLLGGRSEEGVAAALLRNQLEDMREVLSRSDVERRLGGEQVQQHQSKMRALQQQIGRLEQQQFGTEREATREREHAAVQAAHHDGQLHALQQEVQAMERTLGEVGLRVRTANYCGLAIVLRSMVHGLQHAQILAHAAPLQVSSLQTMNPHLRSQLLLHKQALSSGRGSDVLRHAFRFWYWRCYAEDAGLDGAKAEAAARKRHRRKQQLHQREQVLEAKRTQLDRATRSLNSRLNEHRRGVQQLQTKQIHLQPQLYAQRGQQNNGRVRASAPAGLEGGNDCWGWSEKSDSESEFAQRQDRRVSFGELNPSETNRAQGRTRGTGGSKRRAQGHGEPRRCSSSSSSSSRGGAGSSRRREASEVEELLKRRTERLHQQATELHLV